MLEVDLGLLCVVEELSHEQCRSDPDGLFSLDAQLQPTV